MNELILIKYFIINKDIYNKYNKYINIDYIRSNYQELHRIYNTITYIYNNNININTIDDFKAYFYNMYPSIGRSKEADVYETLFQRLQEVNISDHALDTLLEGHRTRYIASELAEVCWGSSNGQRTPQELLESLQRGVESLSDNTSIVDESVEEFVTDNIDILLDRTYASKGLQWKLVTLRKMMGSLRKGNFGVVFARTDSGKTTFVVDSGVHFAKQMDAPLLHFNNEEEGEVLKVRYIQAALGKTVSEINQNRLKSIQDFLAITKGNIKIKDSAIIHRREIEELCRKHKPGLIVIDSLDDIDGFQAERDDLVYKKIYKWARELAKKHCPVIGVCQAAATAEGKEWLEMDDVAYAKTAKQASADWILGIGRSHDSGKEYLRSFYLPKNKLPGDEDFMPEYRNGKIRVQINPEIAQYEDIQFR